MRNELYFASVGLQENINQHLIHLKTLIKSKLNPPYFRQLHLYLKGLRVNWSFGKRDDKTTFLSVKKYNFVSFWI